MQNAPMNKNLMILLIVVVALGAIYGVYALISGGGMSTSDIPSNLTTTPPATSAPAPATPPPAAPGAPSTGAPAGAPEQGGQQPAMPGIGGPAPGGPAAPGGGAGAGAPTPPGGAAPPPSTGGQAAPPAGGAAPPPASPVAGMTEKQKTDALKAFEKVDSHDIMLKRQEEAKDSETKIEPEKDLPYPDTGRTDPLFVVSEAVPEELRPPRTGETDYDSILDFLITAYGTELLDQVQIEVWSVMQIGMEKYVNMSINGMLATVPEGRGGTLANGVSIMVASANQDEVVIVLSFSSQYSSVSKTKSYIPLE